MNKYQTYGYIRVSSRDQNEGRRRIALSACNISGRNLFIKPIDEDVFMEKGHKLLKEEKKKLSWDDI